MNDEKFDYLGITEYHKNYFKGKGIRIGVIDADFNIRRSHLNNVNAVAGAKGIDTGERHGKCVCDVIHQVAPDAELYLMGRLSPDGIEAMKWAIGNDIDIITMSNTLPNIQTNDWFYQEFEKLSKQAHKQGILMFCSAGNNEANKSNFPAFLPEWIAVGAVNTDKTRKYYSNTCENLEFVSYTDLRCTGETLIFGGTSCATPLLAGMAALLMQRIGKRKPDEMRRYMQLFSEDLYEAGRDAQTGYGLFKLPPLNIGLSGKGKASVMVQKGNSNSWIFLDSISEFLDDGWQLDMDSKMLDKLKKYNNRR